MSADEQLPGREVAYRLFAAEFDDSIVSHTESDEERAPNYVITPTGARLNRVFVVGALTEVTSVNDEMLRARVVDPTGAFVVYAGQYQPEALAFLEQAEPPAFVAVTGKARTYSPDDADVVYTSVRPESIASVDADTRERWVTTTAEQTIKRVGTYAAAAGLEARDDALETALQEAGVERGLAAGIPLAQDHYGTTPTYLAAVHELALEAAQVIAGDLDQVSGLESQPEASEPGAPGFSTLAEAAGVDLALDRDLDLETAVEPDDEAQPEAHPAETRSGESESEAEAESSSPQTVSADAGGTDGASEAVDAAPAAADGDSQSAADEAEKPPMEEAETPAEPATTTEFDEDDLEEADADMDGDLEDGGMYEMDDEEREQLEAEFGAEFSTGAEVGDPGEADIDVPTDEEPDDEPSSSVDDPGTFEPVGESEPEEDEGIGDDVEDGDADADTPSAEEPDEPLEADEEGDEPAEADEPEDGVAEGDDGADEPAEAEDQDEATATDLEDIDLQALVVDTMSDLDDGDGADREAVVDTVVDETGADPTDVDEAIEDALMGGQCYEPGDGKLKAI